MVGRTSIMAIIGGTFAKLGGGKFANGAMSGAFTHLFNSEVNATKQGISKDELERMKLKRKAISMAYTKAFGKQAHSYMFDKPTTAIAVFKIGAFALTLGAGLYLEAASLYGTEVQQQLVQDFLVQVLEQLLVPKVI